MPRSLLLLSGTGTSAEAEGAGHAHQQQDQPGAFATESNKEQAAPFPASSVGQLPAANVLLKRAADSELSEQSVKQQKQEEGPGVLVLVPCTGERSHPLMQIVL